jgi:D-alanyl-lipoteichoic acid acyltransferase DltB (MBOAT superfamily)
MGNVCYRGRDLYTLPEITIRNYLDYMLFAPICLAGPPISYTSFFSFHTIPSQKSPPYLRTLFLILFFEVYTHYYPVITPNIHQNLLQMSMSSLLFLYFISLKFTVIWRVGRLWALLYGVDVIDNMGRCMFNNYGF